MKKIEQTSGLRDSVFHASCIKMMRKRVGRKTWVIFFLLIVQEIPMILSLSPSPRTEHEMEI